MKIKQQEMKGKPLKEDESEYNKPRIYMDQLLKLSDSLSEKEIMHNVCTMIAAVSSQWIH